MNSNTLDNPLTKKDLREILTDIRNAGYRNSFLHSNGYILTQKSTLVKVRIVLNNDREAVVSTLAIGSKEIVGNTVLTVFALLVGGFFILAILIYFLVKAISYLIALPKIRAFKAEIEEIIKSA